MNEEKHFPERKPTRLRGYDYSNYGGYFITICAQGRKQRFSRVGEGLPLPQLTTEGKIVEKWICDIHVTYPNVFVDQYVIMPNHIHLLLTIRDLGGRGDPSPTIGAIIGRLKYFATVEINAHNKADGQKIFQRSYHDHIIRNGKDYEKIFDYIQNNPARWEDDCFYAAE